MGVKVIRHGIALSGIDFRNASVSKDFPRPFPTQAIIISEQIDLSDKFDRRSLV